MRVGYHLKVFDFWNKGDEDLVYRCNGGIPIEKLQNCLKNILSNNLPIILQETHLKAIRVRGFQLCQVKSIFFYFIFRKWRAEKSFYVLREGEVARINDFPYLVIGRA